MALEASQRLLHTGSMDEGLEAPAQMKWKCLSGGASAAYLAAPLLRSFESLASSEHEKCSLGRRPAKPRLTEPARALESG